MPQEGQTFLFADLAGFTALTEAHGDERAADVALAFCAELNRVLPAGAEDLKMLGDACLVRVEDAADAVHLGVVLTHGLAAELGLPDVRVGMHTGTAARRGNDWFGAAVNLAARVGALAGAGEALVTAATLEAAGDPAGVRFESRGEHQLRHVSRPVRLFLARSASADSQVGAVAVDPVCRMRLIVAARTAAIVHAGVEYSFCSALCAEQFARAPERYRRA